jgi:hypothetical protein
MDADDISHPHAWRSKSRTSKHIPTVGVLGTRKRDFSSTVEESRGMRSFVLWQNAIITPQTHYVKRFVDAPAGPPHSDVQARDLWGSMAAMSTGALPEDHELWLRWMDAGVRFAKLPEELLTWNDHAQRLSRTHPNYSVDAFFRTKVQWLAKLDKAQAEWPTDHRRGHEHPVPHRAATWKPRAFAVQRFHRYASARGTGLRFHSPRSTAPCWQGLHRVVDQPARHG